MLMKHNNSELHFPLLFKKVVGASSEWLVKFYEPFHKAREFFAEKNYRLKAHQPKNMKQPASIALWKYAREKNNCHIF